MKLYCVFIITFLLGPSCMTLKSMDAKTEDIYLNIFLRGILYKPDYHSQNYRFESKREKDIQYYYLVDILRKTKKVIPLNLYIWYVDLISSPNKKTFATFGTLIKQEKGLASFIIDSVRFRQKVFDQ